MRFLQVAVPGVSGGAAGWLYRIAICLVPSAMLVGTGCPLAAQVSNARLAFADAVRMLDCEPAGMSPCFRLKLNIVDARGAPLAMDLPSPQGMRDAIAIHVNGLDVNPFFASAQNTNGKAAVRGRIALILIDISGSMNQKLNTGQTRFEAAKGGVLRFLDGFEEGVDRVAVAPFESHAVESTIRAAQFVNTRQGALDQVNALPVPGPKNNTALFSAISFGLDSLNQMTRSRSSDAVAPESLLIVMTDGKNEILRGDDPGLLEGPSGLEEAAHKRESAGRQVIGIGFGNPSEVDQASLRRLSTNFEMASDAEALGQAFSFARTLLNNRITATFTSPWQDRASLAGRILQISATLKLPSGTSIGSDEATWSPPQIGIPLFEDKCATAEMSALFHNSSTAVSPNWLTFVRPIGVFLGMGLLLIILWSWVPRLVWPEQYFGVPPSAARWARSSTSSGRPSADAPRAFGTAARGKRTASRKPLDETVVMPDTESTKTRLERDK
jgi:Mg-chelatase subunit ChlD